MSTKVGADACAKQYRDAYSTRPGYAPTDELANEERVAMDTPEEAAIHTANLSRETISERAAELERLADEYRGAFSSYEDAMYFAMLPLTDTTRKSILVRARQLKEYDESLLN
jgi:hypothetical protein